MSKESHPDDEKKPKRPRWLKNLRIDAVSLVNAPAVPKAIWRVVKSEEVHMELEQVIQEMAARVASQAETIKAQQAQIEGLVSRLNADVELSDPEMLTQVSQMLDKLKESGSLTPELLNQLNHDIQQIIGDGSDE